MRVISQKLRDSARGQDCTLRLPCCNHNPETTVLAHLPCGMKGVGMKSPDFFGAFLCSACHSFVDGPDRWNVEARDYMRALAETQMKWVEMGLLKIAGVKV